jgi:kynurenine formamidase
MSKFIDLSHFFEDSMPGFKIKNEDGTYTQYTAKIYPFLSHEQTRPKFKGQAEFEITQMEFQSSLGTYLDSPYHRHKNKKDISQIDIQDTIKEGIVIDARSRSSWEKIGLDYLPKANLRGKAILFNFGWDKYWGKEQYFTYPFISDELIDELIQKEVSLVGVDTINIDDSRDLKRPAHTKLLDNEILIVENLKNLEMLHNYNFKFYCVPIKAKKVAAMPIRAFAEILNNK